MSALGNDFAVFQTEKLPDEGTVRAIAERRRGVGCDQVIVLAPPEDDDADARMHVYNRDGSKVESCGNAARAVALLLSRQTGRTELAIAMKDRLLDAEILGDVIRVDMGIARQDWRDIPLAKPVDTQNLPLAVGEFKRPAAVNMGNPHAVFFVADAERVPLESLGGTIENHKLFPERTNVEAVSAADNGLRLRVWERGVGITPACGSGACAALVAAVQRGLSSRKNLVIMDGGELTVEWLADGHVLMSGGAQLNFSGTLPEEIWE